MFQTFVEFDVFVGELVVDAYTNGKYCDRKLRCSVFLPASPTVSRLRTRTPLTSFACFAGVSSTR